MFETTDAATEKFGMPETLPLTQFLKAVLLLQVIVVWCWWQQQARRAAVETPELSLS